MSDVRSSIRVTEAMADRFIAAVASGQFDLGDAARAAGLQFQEAAEIYAIEAHRNRMHLHDDGPGFRWLKIGPAPE